MPTRMVASILLVFLGLRNSHTFARAVITAAAEGQLLHRDAAHLLNVKVRALDAVSERLLGGRILGG